MTTLGALVGEARARFAAAGLPDAAIEARILIGGLLGLTHTEVFTGADRAVSAAERADIENAIARRLKREPVHRILGVREFHGMPMRLSRGTLEPRSDTEVLVDAMLPYARQVAAAKGAVRILDLGTGTGAILLALLKECPEATGLGADISADALQTAQANAAALGLQDRFEAVRSDWFQNIGQRFDMIVSNPPYIRTDVIATLEPEVRNFDPLAALDGGPDGMDAYRTIAAGAAEVLEPGGTVGVEIGFDQKDAVSELFTSKGYVPVQSVCDFGGNDRVLVMTRQGPDT